MRCAYAWCNVRFETLGTRGVSSILRQEDWILSLGALLVLGLSQGLVVLVLEVHDVCGYGAYDSYELGGGVNHSEFLN